MAVPTFEEIISKSFTIKEYPARQELYESDISALDKMQVLGKISIAQANLYHWSNQLTALGEATINGAKTNDDLSPEQKQTLSKITQERESVDELMWKLIRNQFPKGADPDIFSRMTVLPDWQVAGIYLTDEDRRQQEDQRKALLSFLGIQTH